MAAPRVPSPKKIEQLRPNFLLNLDEYMQRAKRQVACAREMIETARQMSQIAGEMRKRPRLLP